MPDESFKINPASTKVYPINVAAPPANVLSINTSEDTLLQIAVEGQMMVRIHRDGTIDYGPDYDPDVAARTFWDAMARHFPAHAQEPPLHT